MYRFKLEALLNHRRHQEETCQKELARARKKLVDEQEKLGRRKKEKRENVERMKKKQKERTTVSDIILYVNYIKQLSKNIDDQTRHVHEANKKVDQLHHELILSMKKRKTLERLKDKGRKAYQQKVMQDERKLMDEIASTRHVRSQL
jgi:flagellar FliJ protein